MEDIIYTPVSEYIQIFKFAQFMLTVAIFGEWDIFGIFFFFTIFVLVWFFVKTVKKYIFWYSEINKLFLNS
jgi:hypothetical protein